MRRRALLQAAGCVATAGCQSILPDDTEPLRLGVVEFRNWVEGEQTLGIAVSADDELVSETTVTLEPATTNQPSGARLEKEWPDEAGSYTLRVETEVEDDPVEVRIAEDLAESCETVLGTVRADRLEMARGVAGQCYGEG